MIRPLATFDTIWMTFNQGEPTSTVLKRETASLGNSTGPETYHAQLQVVGLGRGKATSVVGCNKRAGVALAVGCG